MIRSLVYSVALRMLPPPRLALEGSGLAPQQEKELHAMLRRHRSRAAELMLFNMDGISAHYLYGAKQPRFFRIASISKMATAACVLKLHEQGQMDLQRDISDWLPYPVRNPHAQDQPIDLSMLLTHTSSLYDSAAYHAALGYRAPVPQLLPASFCTYAPGEQWNYSNFGAGLIACVLEAALQKSFEQIMQETLFGPLGITASFYPQRIAAELADAVRVLPPSRKPGFDAAERKRRPLADADMPVPELHYTLAQGNCCMTAEGLSQLMRALMVPGFLKQETLERMRAPVAGFGNRSPYLQQGVGLHILNDPGVSPHTLYGHQGNAYGAVHAAFFYLSTNRGLVFLSEGISEAKRAFLASAVEDILNLGFKEAAWTETS